MQYESVVATLLKWLAHGRLCPVLGAGASADLDIPQWRGLVERIVDPHGITPKDLDGEDLAFVYELVSQTRSGRRHQDVRRALYRDVPETWTDAPEFSETALYDLARLAIMVAYQWRDKPFHAITYNFDTLLEEAVAALGYQSIAQAEGETGRVLKYWQPICEPTLRRGTESPPTIRVLHPHGVVPRPNTGRGLPAGVVFSSGDYYRLRDRPLSPLMISQLISQTTFNAFYYGISFADDSLRYLVRCGSMTRDMLGQDGRSSHVALIKGVGRASSGKKTMDRLKDDWLKSQHITRTGRKSYAAHRLLLRNVVRRGLCEGKIEEHA